MIFPEIINGQLWSGLPCRKWFFKEKQSVKNDMRYQPSMHNFPPHYSSGMNPLQEPSARGLSSSFCRSTVLWTPSCTRWPRGPLKRHCSRCGPTTGSGDPYSAAIRLICLPLHGRKCGLCKKTAKPFAPRTTWRIRLKCPTTLGPPSYCPWRGRKGHEVVWWGPAIRITSCFTLIPTEHTFFCMFVDVSIHVLTQSRDNNDAVHLRSVCRCVCVCVCY